MELSRLVRTALAALSSMVTTSLACWISMGRVVDVRVLREFLAENILLADQDDVDPQRAGGANGAIHLGLSGRDRHPLRPPRW